MTITQLNRNSRRSRIPPHDLDAEQCALGAALESRAALIDVLEILCPADFYKPAHARIYEAMLALDAAGQAVDVITLADELARRGILDDIGGRPYLLGLLEAYPTASSAAHYARIVSDHACLRRLITAADKTLELSYSIPSDVDAALDQAESLIYAVADRRMEDAEPLSALVGPRLERIQEIGERGSAVTGLSSGFADLDRLTAGFQPGNLVIVAARPSQGKSALVGNIALHAALNEQVPVMFFSLEMSKGEMVDRFLSAEGRIDSYRLRTGNLEDNQWLRLAAVAGRVSEAPVYIEESASVTLTEMRAKCRRLKAKQGLGLVVVDYLQQMESPPQAQNREQAVAQLSRGLKALAKDLDVPVICAAQLNREVEYRADKRPMLADLRESGKIEMDADLVLFIYRDELYNRDSPNKGQAEIILAKHRNGPTGVTRLAFFGRFSMFAPLAV